MGAAPAGQTFSFRCIHKFCVPIFPRYQLDNRRDIHIRCLPNWIRLYRQASSGLRGIDSSHNLKIYPHTLRPPDDHDLFICAFQQYSWTYRQKIFWIIHSPSPFNVFWFSKYIPKTRPLLTEPIKSFVIFHVPQLYANKNILIFLVFLWVCNWYANCMTWLYGFLY